ncbi:MAG: hypothetical protein V7L01_07545 [Nostoc sp.]|uniref:hypothetical protein n=1 Tax=Nostoc sp. TaxID=1180 RepID=UPI002FF93594
MQSTLFTELTASEEANLSGGFSVKKFFNNKKSSNINKSFNNQNANGGIATSGINIIIGTNNTINTSANGGSNNIS